MALMTRVLARLGSTVTFEYLGRVGDAHCCTPHRALATPGLSGLSVGCK